MNLLIVDDEQEIVEGILAGVEWNSLAFGQVFYCYNGDEAIDYFKKHTIDILLCDIEMPFMSGLKLLQWIREQEYDTECMFLTCHGDFNYAREALKLQTMDYILKPVPYGQLRDILRSAIVRLEKKRLVNEYARHGRESLCSIMDKTEFSLPRSTQLIQKIKQYIQEHLTEDLTADRVAGAMYISTDYLFRVFKKEENMTLVEYITRERMFCARELLKKPGMSVSQAAITAGYNNYCYFIRVFKRTFGMTPSEYQRKY